MFKVLENGKAPTKGSRYSAGIDLYASEDCIIAAGQTKIIGLGVCIDEIKLIECVLPLHREYYVRTGDFKVFKNFYENLFLKSHYLELHPRSSLRAKGLISNTGIIDLDYEDEIKIIIHNPIQRFGSFPVLTDEFEIKKGQKIAQILLKEHKGYLLGIKSDEERTGGFGSTDE